MIKELNRVMDYIEDHIKDDFSLDKIFESSGIPDFHFRTIFFHLSGMTLNEYIKYRKLSEANKDLLKGEMVTDVAFKYGYQSIDGFTRAFKKWTGFLPSDVAKKGISKSFPKLSFIITIKGGIPMEFRIEEKPRFNIVGVSGRVPMQFEGVNKEIVKLAMSITEDQRKEMHAIQNMEPYEIVNASYDADADFIREEGYLTHMIGVLTTENNVSEHLDRITIDACTWAVFPNEGPFPATMQNTMAMIYSEWLPSSDYELIKAPTFSFTKHDEDKKDYAYSEIWIPVKKKQ